MRRETFIQTARKRWPKAVWIIGNGPYASVAYCQATTVMLFGTQAEAEIAKSLIDRTGCGGRCIKHHKIISLLPPKE